MMTAAGSIIQSSGGSIAPTASQLASSNAGSDAVGNLNTTVPFEIPPSLQQMIPAMIVGKLGGMAGSAAGSAAGGGGGAGGGGASALGSAAGSMATLGIGPPTIQQQINDPSTMGQTDNYTDTVMNYQVPNVPASAEGGYTSGAGSARMHHHRIPMHHLVRGPSYAEGTPNTSGGIPSVLHPNEAVIPLSRGRSIPVSMKGGGGMGGTTNHVNVNIVTPDADSFRKSDNQLQSSMALAMSRAANRNGVG